MHRPIAPLFRTAALAALLAPGPSPAAPDPLTLDRAETAGLSMFRAHWDVPLVLTADAPLTVVDGAVTNRGGTAVWKNGGGALAFDALNRSLLVRFPDAAEKIAEAVRQGKSVARAEVILPFRDEELWPVGNSDYIGPEGYEVRKNWGTDALYRAVRPEWHAVAWALRRPWTADPARGPTFNASVNGACFWTRYGAQDERTDRFPERFGPAEVSYKHPEGRLDVTGCLTSPAYGNSLAERLRTFADCGLLIQKWETYDHRYYTGCYEWSTACGGRAIVVGAPKLVVTFAPGRTDVGQLPPPADLAAQKGGAPTAIMPDIGKLTAFAESRAAKPAWMPDWQWQRVRELYLLADAEKAALPFWYQFVPDYQIQRLRESYRDPAKPGIQFRPPDPAKVYAAWVDMIVGRQPRGWSGFESAREMTQWYQYGEALPEPARDAIRRYWLAWLMPDRETAPREKQRDIDYVDGPLVHPMVQDDRVGKGPPPNPLNGLFDVYWARTGDWRGNKSFFRSGFTWWMSTQNFNTTASAGALLAGAIVGSERAMADGRYGVETFPLRMYCWADGSGQEHIDHYYYAVTLSGNKAVADFSQTPYDRLVGQSLLAKNVEELISAYHPGLRAFIAGSSRTSFEFLLGTQDGLQFLMHTLSRSGTLRDAGTTTLPGNIPVIGHEVPPRVVAQQTQAGPWAPEWVVPMVDDKPLPYLAMHSMWGGGLRTCYLGADYGLFSMDGGQGRIQNMAQWRRAAKQVERSTDLGTLDVRYGVNETRFVNDAGGYIVQRGSHTAFQYRNKLIFLASPKCWLGGFHGDKARGDVVSMQSSLGLFTLQEKPTWTVWIDGRPVDSLPAACRQGQRITIRDGVTAIGVIPLPATDLGRDDEVVLEEGREQKYDQYKAVVRPSLLIHSFNYRRAAPFPEEPREKWIDVGKAYGGFVVQLEDVAEDGRFERFQKEMADATVKVGFDAASNAVRVAYAGGGDTLETAALTWEPDEKQPGHETGRMACTLRRANGQEYGLPAGVERDTPYARQALGRAEKNGAVLEADEGRRVFLLTEPKGGVYCGWNPLPDLTSFRFALAGGVSVAADGKVGLTRVLVRPAANEIAIDSAFKPGQEKEPGVATAFRIAGAADKFRVTLNGRPAELRRDGKEWTAPLR
jgi:hypothetical protein